MNELEFYMILITLSPFVVFGFVWLYDKLHQILGYTRVLTLKKDGRYSLTWMKIKNKKNIEVEGKQKIIDPKGRFIGPLGNLFVYVGDNARPIVTDDTEISGEIDVDDVSTITTLAYYAGKLSAMGRLDTLEKLMYLNLAVLVVVGVLMAMYWQDRTQYLEYLKHLAVSIKELSTTVPKP